MEFGDSGLEDHFWSKVEVSDSGCWEWTASLDTGGYAQLGRGGKNLRGHRVAFQAAGNTLVRGLVIDHLCRNRKCVNPDHLEQVSNQENLRRGESPSAENSRKTHCKNGHPLSGENLFVARNSSRQCRICQRRRKRESHRRNREKNLERMRAYRTRMKEQNSKGA